MTVCGIFCLVKTVRAKVCSPSMAPQKERKLNLPAAGLQHTQTGLKLEDIGLIYEEKGKRMEWDRWRVGGAAFHNCSRQEVSESPWKSRQNTRLDRAIFPNISHREFGGRICRRAHMMGPRLLFLRQSPEYTLKQAGPHNKNNHVSLTDIMTFTNPFVWIILVVTVTISLASPFFLYCLPRFISLHTLALLASLFEKGEAPLKH